MNQTKLEKHNKDLIRILLAIRPMTTDEVMEYVNKVNKLYGSLIEAERFETLKKLVGAANSILKNKNADWRFNFDSYGNLVVQTLEQHETQTEGDNK